MSRAQKIAELSAETMYASDHTAPHFGIKLVSIAEGEAAMSMIIQDWMLNGHKTCHGGMIFTLADSTFAFACNSYNTNAVAQLATITFIAPVYLGDELTAMAREVARYGRNGIYDVKVHNQNNELIAEFRGHSRMIKGEHVENIDEVIAAQS